MIFIYVTIVRYYFWFIVRSLSDVIFDSLSHHCQMLFLIHCHTIVKCYVLFIVTPCQMLFLIHCQTIVRCYFWFIVRPLSDVIFDYCQTIVRCYLLIHWQIIVRCYLLIHCQIIVRCYLLIHCQTIVRCYLLIAPLLRRNDFGIGFVHSSIHSWRFLRNGL